MRAGIGVRRTRRAARLVAALAAVLALAPLAGCGGQGPEPTSSSSTRPSSNTASPTSSPSLTPSPTPSPTPSDSLTPASDGATLRELGFRNGPLDAFSIPRGAVVRTAADQPNVVTLVLTWPSPTDVAGQLRRTLPAYGWEITADDRATRTLTFTGPGSGARWNGTFTATDGTSAIVLQAQ